MRASLPGPEELDVEWLAQALGAAGSGLEDVELVGEVGTGQAARTVRYRLTWSDPEGRPASVVAKFPSDDEGARATLAATGGYRKEWLFYHRLAATVALRVPHCHAAAYDEESAEFVLVMEDLDRSAPGDQLAGLRADQVALAVQQAAGLHGPRYGDRTLPDALAAGSAEGGGEAATGDAGAFCQQMYEAVLPDFAERYGAALSPEEMDLVERAQAHVAAWFRGTPSPRTLVHQDLRADNLLFGVEPGAPEIAVVDFQALAVGVGATDVAYLLGGSLADAAQRAAIEVDLLEEYRGALGSHGVELSAPELWRDYRHGSLWGVIMTVLSSLAAERTERGDEMFTAMARRHARHALDLDALALFD